MKVFLLNNYSMRAAQSRVEAGEYPPQHLYGHSSARRAPDRPSSWLPIGRSLFDIVRGSSRPWRAVRAAVLRSIGDPILEIVPVLRRNDVDVIFAADQWSAGGLLTLKRWGVPLPPVVVLVHHPPRTPRQLRLLSAADRLVTLGPRTADALDLATGSRPPVLPWGPDPEAAVYQRVRNSGPAKYDFIAAGRTNRRYTALLDLARADRLNGLVFDGTHRWDVVDGRVERRTQTEDYLDILFEMSLARSVVMPFDRPEVMSGLTEAADAIALGIPILATRSSAFPYDLVGTGGGAVAEDNTVEDLRKGFARLSGSDRGASKLLANYSLDLYEAALDAELAAAVRARA